MIYGQELIEQTWENDLEWNYKNYHPIKDGQPQVYRNIIRQLNLETIKIKIDDQPKILDVCGGRSTHLYLPENLLPFTTVLDGNQKFLDQSIAAIKRLGDTHEKLPFPDNQFDLVVSFFGMRYAPIPPLINEIVRILKPGGTVVLFDFDKIDHNQEEDIFKPTNLIPILADKVMHLKTKKNC